MVGVIDEAVANDVVQKFEMIIFQCGELIEVRTEGFILLFDDPEEEIVLECF